jgi:hypothetical protein
MENHVDRRSRHGNGVFLGVVLVLAGIMFLAAEVIPIDISRFGWPLVLIGLGIAFFIRAATWRRET